MTDEISDFERNYKESRVPVQQDLGKQEREREQIEDAQALLPGGDNEDIQDLDKVRYVVMKLAQIISEEKKPLTDLVVQSLMSGDASGRDAAIRKIDVIDKYVKAIRDFDQGWKKFINGDGTTHTEPTFSFETKVSQIMPAMRAPAVTRTRRPNGTASNGSSNGSPSPQLGAVPRTAEEDLAAPRTTKQGYVPYYLEAFLELPEEGAANREIQDQMWEIFKVSGNRLPGDDTMLKDGYPRWKKTSDHIGSDLVMNDLAEKTGFGSYKLTEQGRAYAEQSRSHRLLNTPPPPPIRTFAHSERRKGDEDEEDEMETAGIRNARNPAAVSSLDEALEKLGDSSEPSAFVQPSLPSFDESDEDKVVIG